MADEKKVEPIRLVAIERGFVLGRLVEPGESFLFSPVGANGKPRKLPSWAAPVGDERLNKPARRSAGDLKPKAAQDAVKAKAVVLAGAGEAA